ncbi:hypothetical protein [Alloacidobacterium sp.]|uniref:hypothetical protein n=1 Tax=Alloacidobacterium sp. TaxID=2951999 RepID=UPI002D67D2AD|nr:hypothetical protein [Alloacidobacterium sp.]HYK34794.1 hypothetical protein [Alloacidobacterium sp.]
METVCARVTVFGKSLSSLMKPGQQRDTHGQNTHGDPELRVSQNCFQHLDKPNGKAPGLSKKIPTGNAYIDEKLRHTARNKFFARIATCFLLTVFTLSVSGRSLNCSATER